jgi:hypothetical protein
MVRQNHKSVADGGDPGQLDAHPATMLRISCTPQVS